MRSAAIQAVAQKYVDEARRATRPLYFRDALVTENEIIVKADAFAENLTGFLGYRFQLGRRGALGRPEVVTLPNPPNQYTFLTWAKSQPTKVLRTLLKANGIRATGTVHIPMAHLLTLLYEDRQATVVGIPIVRSERSAEIHAKRIKALTLAVTLAGIRDEEVLVQVGFWVERGNIDGQFTKYVQRLKERGMEEKAREEKASDIRKRLMDEAENGKDTGKPRRTAEDAPESGEADETPKSRQTEKAKKGEQEAIVAGKGKKKGTEETAAKKEKPKKSETKESETKSDGKAKGKAKAKKEKPKKTETKKEAKSEKPEKASRKNGPVQTGMKQSDFKNGDKVKYLGSRNEELKGKTLEITGTRGPDGLWLKTGDGTRASAMAHQLEKIKK